MRAERATAAGWVSAGLALALMACDGGAGPAGGDADAARDADAATEVDRSLDDGTAEDAAVGDAGPDEDATDAADGSEVTDAGLDGHLADAADAGPDGVGDADVGAAGEADAGGEVDTFSVDPLDGETIPLEASEAFESRKETYLEACVADNGPGQGGIYGQSCRVAAGAETFDQGAIDAALAKLEAREDTSDFTAAGLLRMLYLNDETGALDESTREDIAQTMRDFKYWIDEPGEDQMSYWTENHQVLFHSAELLAGQRWPDTEFSNAGMTGAEHVAHAKPRVERWLDLRGRVGFSEWHSDIYFNEDVPALVNLADFAEDPVIREKARMVLDIIALDFLNNIYDGWFATVHGRTAPKKWLGGMSDSTREGAWLMVGLGDYDSTGDFSGAFLATSDGYAPPPLLEELAVEVRDKHEHRQRDSLRVEEGPTYGIGYEGLDDTVVWAGLQALVHPKVVQGATAVLDEHDLWDGFLFSQLPDNLLTLLQNLAGEPGIVTLAEELAPVSRGLALEAMDTYVHRTPHYQLAGAQDYKPGFWNVQTMMWQATLDREAFVLTVGHASIEGVGDAEDAAASLNDPWNGGWHPRVTMTDEVGVIQYQRGELSPILADRIGEEYSHAYFPQSAFDEVVEEGHWVFGRKDEGYVALWSEHEPYWSEENDFDLRVDQLDNDWVVQLGSSASFDGFDAFVDAVTSAEISGGETVSYASPTAGEVSVGWTGPMTVDGEPVDLGPYPRWSNDHQQTPHGAPITRVELGDRILELDFTEPQRRLVEVDAP